MYCVVSTGYKVRLKLFGSAQDNSIDPTKDHMWHTEISTSLYWSHSTFHPTMVPPP